MSVDILVNPILPADPLGSISRLAVNSAGKGAAGASAAQAARDFESILLHKVLEEMRRSIPESGLLDSAVTQQVQDLFWFYLAQDVSSKGGLGLWRQLYGQFQQSNPAGPGGESPGAEK